MTATRVPALARPTTTAELASALAAAVRPVVMGGGTILMPLLSSSRRRPDLVVGLDRLSAAAELRDRPTDGASIGPLTPYAAFTRPASSPRSAAVALLARIARGITGGPQLHHQGTIVGAACHANPASDMPTGLTACDATFHVVGPHGPRTIPARQFFTAPYTTALAESEAVVGISVPHLDTTGIGYCKLKRSASSWPLAAAAAIRRPDGTIRVVLGAAVERPLTFDLPEHVDLAPRALAGQIDAAREQADIAYWADELAERDYRRRIAPIAAARAITESLADDV